MLEHSEQTTDGCSLVVEVHFSLILPCNMITGILGGVAMWVKPLCQWAEGYQFKSCAGQSDFTVGPMSKFSQVLADPASSSACAKMDKRICSVNGS